MCGIYLEADILAAYQDSPLPWHDGFMRKSDLQLAVLVGRDHTHILNIGSDYASTVLRVPRKKRTAVASVLVQLSRSRCLDLTIAFEPPVQDDVKTAFIDGAMALTTKLTFMPWPPLIVAAMTVPTSRGSPRGMRL